MKFGDKNLMALAATAACVSLSFPVFAAVNSDAFCQDAKSVAQSAAAIRLQEPNIGASYGVYNLNHGTEREVLYWNYILKDAYEADSFGLTADEYGELVYSHCQTHAGDVFFEALRERLKR